MAVITISILIYLPCSNQDQHSAHTASSASKMKNSYDC